MQIMQHVRKAIFEPINTSPWVRQSTVRSLNGQRSEAKGQPPKGYVHLVIKGPPRFGNSLLAHVYDHDHITQ